MADIGLISESDIDTLKWRRDAPVGIYEVLHTRQRGEGYDLASDEWVCAVWADYVQVGNRQLPDFVSWQWRQDGLIVARMRARVPGTETARRAAR